MKQELNALGQPVGHALPHWSPPPPPPPDSLQGRFCVVEPLNPDQHASALFAADSLDTDGRSWTYLPYGPFPGLESYREWMETACRVKDPLPFAILDASGQPVGVACYLRIQPAAGSIEVGGIHYSPLLQRQPAATEAMFLMMRQAFALGYRRYEWKCDSLNAASRSAAQRLGFSFEGIFRQATVYKGRSRDTAWYSVIDSEWPEVRAAFEEWLHPGNFDEEGRQRVSLPTLTGPLLKARG